MTIKDVEKLALLARVEISDAEKQEFLANMESILDYVGQIQEVVTDAGIMNYELRIKNEIHNVMREDDNPRESGQYTEKILANAPETRDGYFKVKQIL